MSAAGDYTRRVTFQRRAADANGDRTGDFADVVTRNAKVIPKVGGEAVQAQRLEGAQPAVIIVRRDSVTRTIDNSFRAFDAREPTIVWNLVSFFWNEVTNDMELLGVHNINGDDG